MKIKQISAVTFSFFLTMLFSYGQTIEKVQQGDPNFHLYLLVGQSNMAGRGKIDSLSCPNNPNLLMLTTDNDWIVSYDPLHFDKPKIAGVGPGLSFGQEMLKYQKDRKVKVGLIPCAVGGSSIDMWQTGKVAHDSISHPYDDAIRRLKFAMKDGVVKGIIWHQGESDSSESKSKVYIEKLERLINRFRSEIGDLNVPFVAGELGYYRDRYMNVNHVLQKLPSTVPYTAVANAQGLIHNGDGTHFDSKSARELGKRMAIQMHELQSYLKQENLILPEFIKINKYTSWSPLFLNAQDTEHWCYRKLEIQ